MLARDLSMTVGRLRQSMSNAEFVEWAALYQREAIEREKAAAKSRPKGRR